MIIKHLQWLLNQSALNTHIQMRFSHLCIIYEIYMEGKFFVQIKNIFLQIELYIHVYFNPHEIYTDVFSECWNMSVYMYVYIYMYVCMCVFLMLLPHLGLHSIPKYISKETQTMMCAVQEINVFHIVLETALYQSILTIVLLYFTQQGALGTFEPDQEDMSVALSEENKNKNRNLEFVPCEFFSHGQTALPQV